MVRVQALFHVVYDSITYTPGQMFSMDFAHASTAVRFGMVKRLAS